MIRSLLVALFALALALPSLVDYGASAHAQETPPERPNVVFILTLALTDEPAVDSGKRPIPLPGPPYGPP